MNLSIKLIDLQTYTTTTMDTLTLASATAFALDTAEAELVTGGFRRTRTTYLNPTTQRILYRTVTPPSTALPPINDRRQNAIIGVDDQN